MISVCIASFNGEKYIEEQMRSILCSERVGEVIVSDDGSRDRTREIVAAIDDPRIRLVDGPRAGLIRNFENALRQARGDYIFLADQDDVWLPGKVDTMMAALAEVDVAVSDCRVVDADLNVLSPSFFRIRHSGPGLVKNLLRNSYLGCCMAFRRPVLAASLPFPANIPMHDWWIGLVAERTARVRFIDVPLLHYRRHGGNASPTSQRSHASRRTQIAWRISLLRALLVRRARPL
ncbi:MAG: glycosyltransferase family 2 protein [Betaproteobacteria bacterium]